MNIQDYSNWTHQLPSKPTKADWNRLKNKLNTYIGSSKFLRQGSTIDQYDQTTGKRVKVPIKDVLYKKNLGDEYGISAQDLRQNIKAAVRSNDKQALKDVSDYRFYEATKFKTPKQLAAQQDKKRRKRVLISSAILGGGGLMLGLLPIVQAYKEQQPINKRVLGQAAVTGLAGGAAGLITTGLIQSFM